MSILVDESTRILVLGITGREAVSFTHDTLDYGGRVVAGVTPGRGGRDVHVRARLRHRRGKGGGGCYGVDAAVIAVPPTSPARYPPSLVHRLGGIPLVVIVTERVPRLDAAHSSSSVEAAAREGVRIHRAEQHATLISPGKTEGGHPVGGPAAKPRRGKLRAR